MGADARRICHIQVKWEFVFVFSKNSIQENKNCSVENLHFPRVKKKHFAEGSINTNKSCSTWRNSPTFWSTLNFSGTLWDLHEKRNFANSTAKKGLWFRDEWQKGSLCCSNKISIFELVKNMLNFWCEILIWAPRVWPNNWLRTPMFMLQCYSIHIQFPFFLLILLSWWHQRLIWFSVLNSSNTLWIANNVQLCKRQRHRRSKNYQKHRFFFCVVSRTIWQCWRYCYHWLHTEYFVFYSIYFFFVFFLVCLEWCVFVFS